MQVWTSCKFIRTANIIYLSFSSLCFYSSVQLLGDLLFKVSGVSGKMTTDTAHEDDNFGTEHSQKVGLLLYFTSQVPIHLSLTLISAWLFFNIYFISQASIHSHQSYKLSVTFCIMYFISQVSIHHPQCDILQHVFHLNYSCTSGHHQNSWRGAKEPSAGRAVHGAVWRGHPGASGGPSRVEGGGDQHTQDAEGDPAHPLLTPPWPPRLYQLRQETGMQTVPSSCHLQLYHYLFCGITF